MKQFFGVLAVLLLAGVAVSPISCGGSATGPILPPPGQANALTLQYPPPGTIFDRTGKYTTGGSISGWTAATLILDCGLGYVDGPYPVVLDGATWHLDYRVPTNWPYLPDCTMWVLSGDNRVADKVVGDKVAVGVSPPPLPLGPS